MAKKAGKVADEENLPEIQVLGDEQPEKVAKKPEKQAEKKPEVVDTKQDDDDEDEVVVTLRAQLKTLEEEKLAEKTAREVAETARSEAEKQKNEATTNAESALQNQIAAQRASIDNGIAAAQAELSSAEQEYERAEEVGEIKAKVAAQKKLARATNMVDQWEGEKNKFDAWETEFKAKEEIRKKAPQSQGTSPAIRDWINSHPRFNTDEEYRESAMHFHRLAVKKGLVPETKGYFEYIDGGLGRVYEEPKPKKAKVQDDEDEETGIQPSSIAAAPSRETPAGVPDNRPKKIKLTKGEMDIVKNRAESDGITLEKAAANYLKNKEKLIAAGIIQGNA